MAARLSFESDTEAFAFARRRMDFIFIGTSTTTIGEWANSKMNDAARAGRRARETRLGGTAESIDRWQGFAAASIGDAFGDGP